MRISRRSFPMASLYACNRRRKSPVVFTVMTLRPLYVHTVGIVGTTGSDVGTIDGATCCTGSLSDDVLNVICACVWLFNSPDLYDRA